MRDGRAPIQSASDEKTGTTPAKAERYEEYFLGHPEGGSARKSFYTRDHPDGFLPELIFLVHSSRRQKSVSTAIDLWRQKRADPRLRIRALTQETAAAELRECLPALGTPTPAPKALPLLARSEILLLRDFFSATVVTLRDLRAKARSAGKQPPSYPPQAEEMKALITRLTTPSMAGRPS